MLEEQEDLATGAPNDLQSLWLPFTPNRQFKAHPRIVVSAKGMHYRSHDGREILDSSAGLWCANLGHCHPKVVAAVQKGVATLDFAPTFQFGHNKVFELASRVAAEMPGDLNRVFFANSGSEAVDTALKIALAYHQARGEGQRTRLIGRERAYHGVGFGGISVGGMVANRRTYGPMLPGVDHLRHTLDLEHNAFSRGQPEWGAHLADDLERLVRAARPLDHRRRDRRAGGGLGRRLSAAQGLSRAPARDLRQARHPLDLRRGDHGLGPARLRVGGRAHGHHARPHDHGQGPHQRACADGCRGLPGRHLRGLHEGPRARHRAVPRLYLLGPSGGRGRGRRRPRGLPGGGHLRAGPRRSSPTSRTRCTRAATCRACATSAISA